MPNWSNSARYRAITRGTSECEIAPFPQPDVRRDERTESRVHRACLQARTHERLGGAPIYTAGEDSHATFT
jgi:hypothetical protein